MEEELFDLLQRYYRYKGYPKRLDLKDFMEWLDSQRVA